MELETSSGCVIRDPIPADIDSALSELARGDGYLILSRAAEDYVQAADNIVEYRDATGHFRHVAATPDAELVRRVFVAFLEERPDWKSLVQWEDVTLETRTLLSRVSPTWVFIVFLLACAAAFVWVLSR